MNASLVEAVLGCLLNCDPGLSCELVKNCTAPCTNYPSNYVRRSFGEAFCHTLSWIWVMFLGLYGTFMLAEHLFQGKMLLLLVQKFFKIWKRRINSKQSSHWATLLSLLYPGRIAYWPNGCAWLGDPLTAGTSEKFGDPVRELYDGQLEINFKKDLPPTTPWTGGTGCSVPMASDLVFLTL